MMIVWSSEAEDLNLRLSVSAENTQEQDDNSKSRAGSVFFTMDQEMTIVEFLNENSSTTRCAWIINIHVNAKLSGTSSAKSHCKKWFQDQRTI